MFLTSSAARAGRGGRRPASPDAKASRAQRTLRAVLDALSPAPRRPPVDGLESRIRKARAAGDPRAAATEAIRGLGPSVLGYLRAVLRNEEDADEAFSQWAETLWRELSTYRGRSSFRAWALRLAWRKASKLREPSYHQRAALPGSGTAEAAAITDDTVYIGSLFPEGKVPKLLESLTARSARCGCCGSTRAYPGRRSPTSWPTAEGRLVPRP